MNRQLVLALCLILLLAVTACGGSDRVSAQDKNATQNQPASAGDAATGQTLFTATCAPCHGPTGEGVQGLAKNINSSEFVAGKSDAELVEFIKVGRDPNDPLNTTKIRMPARGGNPNLTDQDLFHIVAYIRSFQTD